jgi:hypothetical protein
MTCREDRRGGHGAAPLVELADGEPHQSVASGHDIGTLLEALG